MNTCPCSAPCETHLCNPCAFRLEQRLAETDSVLADLELAVPRLTLTATYGERAGGSKALHAPAPVNVDALDAKVALHRFLADTALRLAMATDTPFTNRSPQGLASYLLSNINALRAMDWVGGVLPGLEQVMRGCEQATNRAQRREFAGTCTTEDCGTELWVTIGGDDTRCKTCGAIYTAVQEWRNGARDYARKTDNDILGYPDALSKRLRAIHGEDISPEHIRLLASKGLLCRANPTHGADGKKLRALYRLGDVKTAMGKKAA